MPSFLLAEMIATFRSQKLLAERAISQMSDEHLRTAIAPETNSVAVIIKHLSGNMLSRWTDFLTTDGDKPGRNRDDEFIDTFPSRSAITACWEAGWGCLFHTLGGLTDDDLPRPITIRGEQLTAAGAILRQVSHYGYHVGQIVLIARTLTGDRWQVLTIPKGGSQQYNAQMARRTTP